MQQHQTIKTTLNAWDGSSELVDVNITIDPIKIDIEAVDNADYRFARSISVELTPDGDIQVLIYEGNKEEPVVMKLPLTDAGSPQ